MGCIGAGCGRINGHLGHADLGGNRGQDHERIADHRGLGHRVEIRDILGDLERFQIAVKVLLAPDIAKGQVMRAARQQGAVHHLGPHKPAINRDLQMPVRQINADLVGQPVAQRRALGQQPDLAVGGKGPE